MSVYYVCPHFGVARLKVREGSRAWTDGTSDFLATLLLCEPRNGETAARINLITAIIGYSKAQDIREILPQSSTTRQSTTAPPTPSPSVWLSVYDFPIEPIYLAHSQVLHRKIILTQKQTCLSLHSRHQILTDTLTASVLITSKHPHLETESGN